MHYEVGQFVLLDGKNLHLKHDGVKKLSHRFFGPFEIVKRVGNVAYELKLPPDMLMHDVFHVSLLRPYKRKGNASPEAPPPAILPTGTVEYEVEEIIEHEDDDDKERFFLVKWTGHDRPTWETASNLRNCKGKVKEYFQKLTKKALGSVPIVPSMRNAMNDKAAKPALQPVVFENAEKYWPTASCPNSSSLPAQHSNLRRSVRAKRRRVLYM